MKFGTFIAMTLGVGMLVGWFGPGAPNMASAPQAADEQSPSRLAAMQRDQWLAGETVLPRADDGHFYADVTVDGVSTQMLVDTGATTVALTGDDAEAMGLSWNDADVEPVARGANGLVYGVPVTLGQVSIGDLEARDVEAMIVPDGLDISLLGQSFLQKIEHVEMESDRMVLGG
jgi:aspartyl protease family protein